jgi:hypothetical protein
MYVGANTLKDQGVGGAKSWEREGQLRMRLGTGNLEKGKEDCAGHKGFLGH